MSQGPALRLIGTVTVAPPSHHRTDPQADQVEHQRYSFEQHLLRKHCVEV
jgi:hypothetical protein